MTQNLQVAMLHELALRLATRAVTINDEEASEIALRIVQTCAQLKPPSGPGRSLDVPLHLLDTTANRRYCDALQKAWRAALEVDRERGYGEDGPAQELEEMLAKTRLEVYGPKGKD